MSHVEESEGDYGNSHLAESGADVSRHVPSSRPWTWSHKSMEFARKSRSRAGENRYRATRGGLADDRERDDGGLAMRRTDIHVVRSQRNGGC